MRCNTSGSRRHPMRNRALAYNAYGRSKWCLAQARLHLDVGQRDAATFWAARARGHHSQGRVYQRRLVTQGGSLR